VTIVVLDVDDTLYLESAYVRSGFAAVDGWAREHFDTGGVGDTAWQLFESGVRRTTLTDALAAHGVAVTPEVRASVIDVYRTHDPDIALADDARRFVHGRLADFTWAVVTDGPAASQRAKCSALGLFELADPVVVTADHGSSKPDVAMFKLVEVAHRRTGSELIYVADNPLKDFQGPIALGWRCVRVRRDGALHAGLDTPRGIPEIPDFGDLAAFVD
jgi:putative hydrolase of the HAD superfamily